MKIHPASPDPKLEPIPTPDVATQPHPTSSSSQPPVSAPPTGAGDGLLQEALPQINEAARKVGGFKRLSEIARQLGEAEAE